MFNIKDIRSIKKGDLLVLKDFHTLSAAGNEVSAQITAIQHWTYSGFEMYGFEVQPQPDVVLMLLVRLVGDNFDTRLFRKWDEQLFSSFNAIAMFNDVQEKGGISKTFANFTIAHAGEEADGALPYTLKTPFPLWDVQKPKEVKQVAIAEYMATEVGLEDNYWAKNCFVEWYAYVGNKGNEGLITVWFGWDVSIDDFDVISH